MCIRDRVIDVKNGKISLSIKQLLNEEKKSKAEKREKKKKAAAPRSNRPPEEFDFSLKRNKSDGLSFDDMLKKFKQDSDEKFQALKRSNDSKRSGGYKRTY